MSIENTLKERGQRYGEWKDNAEKAQTIKDLWRDFDEWEKLDDIHKEALDMFAVKIARIFNGDPNYADNWHDIAGFAKLVDEALSPVVIKEPMAYSPDWDLVPLVLSPKGTLLAEPSILRYEDYAPRQPKAHTSEQEAPYDSKL